MWTLPPPSVVLLSLHPLLSPCASQHLPQDFAERCLVRVYGRSKETNQTQLPIPGQFVQAGSEIGFSATPLIKYRASLIAQFVKNPPAMQEIPV